MAEEYVICNKSDLVSVADSIRTKSGTSGAMNFPQDFVSRVDEIEAGGGITPPAYSMVTTTINYNVSMNTNISYLGINEDGILVEKYETLSGSGSIDIVSSRTSLIDGYVDYMLFEPTVTITHQRDDSASIPAYQEALIHHAILSGDGAWFIMLPGGIFNLTVVT